MWRAKVSRWRRARRSIGPGDRLEVVARQPFGGPVAARFGTTEHVLDGGLARAMRVEVDA